MPAFEVVSKHQPQGDQPAAIDKLAQGVLEGKRAQTLLGVTGSGKTFTMANVIAKVQRPTLVISHNKTLAAQLYEEFKELFPKNAVGYFVSYYDYYQPEAYIPQRDIYIEKDASRNDDLGSALRLAATSNLVSRSDVLLVCSVSCIFGLGSPIEYKRSVLADPERRRNRSRQDAAQADRSAIRAERYGFQARHLPRARRCGRAASRVMRNSLTASNFSAITDHQHRRDQSAHRRVAQERGSDLHLSGRSLRDARRSRRQFASNQSAKNSTCR